jgi:hypothetical protein
MAGCGKGNPADMGTNINERTGNRQMGQDGIDQSRPIAAVDGHISGVKVGKIGPIYKASDL